MLLEITFTSKSCFNLSSPHSTLLGRAAASHRDRCNIFFSTFNYYFCENRTFAFQLQHYIKSSLSSPLLPSPSSIIGYFSKRDSLTSFLGEEVVFSNISQLLGGYQGKEPPNFQLDNKNKTSFTLILYQGWDPRSGPRRNSKDSDFLSVRFKIDPKHFQN